MTMVAFDVRRDVLEEMGAVETDEYLRALFGWASATCSWADITYENEAVHFRGQLRPGTGRCAVPLTRVPFGVSTAVPMRGGTAQCP